MAGGLREGENFSGQEVGRLRGGFTVADGGVGEDEVDIDRPIPGQRFVRSVLNSMRKASAWVARTFGNTAAPSGRATPQESPEVHATNHATPGLAPTPMQSV